MNYEFMDLIGEEEQSCEICGTTEGVEFVENPYQVEIYDRHEKEWLCYDCIKDIWGDV
jgi:hypothetical protein